MSSATTPESNIRPTNTKDSTCNVASHAHEHEPGMEPEPPAFSKCFVLSAIVLFIAMGCSSVPNLLSARHPRDSLRAADNPIRVSFTGLNDASLTHSLRPVAETQERRDDRGVWTHATDQSKGTDHPSVHVPAQAGYVGSSATLLEASPASSTQRVFTATTGSQREQFARTSHPPLMQETNVWPLIQAFCWLIFRVCFWTVRASYRVVRLLASKPITAFIAVAEPPYTIMRDICKAFLPVYSFFAVAAVIGVVVGGSATWIAQMLISALGADQEDFHRKVARVGSNGFHAHSSIPLTQRTYDIQKNDGNRPFKSTTSNILLSSDEESPTLAVNERNASAFEAKPNVRVPQEGSPSKRHQIVPEVDDDDDDDDDDDEEDEEEDGDWQHA